MPRVAPPSIPAIVVARGYTALGTLRALAQAGIPAYVACPEDDLATRSRWFRPLPGAAPWHGGIDAHSLSALQTSGLHEAVLIPGADDAALWVADIARGPEQSRWHSSSSSRETLEILQDKSRFAAFLSAASIPHPRSFHVDRLDDIAAIPFAELDRVFIKPADSQSFNNALGKKGVWARNRQEMEAEWQRLHDAGFAVIAQEYVPGSSADHYFIDGFRDRNGAIAGTMARRRLRIHPPDFGNSSYCISVPLADVQGAYDNLDRLLTQLAYRGIFSAEFKRDARNGDFKLLEVNTRAWWYVEFAARCGVNVCEMAYQDALDRPVAPPDAAYRVGAGCVNWINDAKSVRSPGGRHGASWWRVLRQWSGARYHVMRWRDPRPGLHVIADTLKHWLKRAIGA